MHHLNAALSNTVPLRNSRTQLSKFFMLAVILNFLTPLVVIRPLQLFMKGLVASETIPFLPSVNRHVDSRSLHLNCSYYIGDAVNSDNSVSDDSSPRSVDRSDFNVTSDMDLSFPDVG